MHRKIRLEMLDEDLASAVCNSRRHCAIAQTIYRVMQQPIGRVRVMENGVSIAGPDGFRYHYSIPTEAAKLVRDFDNHKEVKPIVFTIHYSHRHRIRPVDDVTKHRVNEARRTRTAALAAAGGKPKAYERGRYGI